MTLAHTILAGHPVARTSGAGAACAPVASCAALYRQQRPVRCAHSADDTVHQPSDRLVSIVLALAIGRHRRKSERVTITHRSNIKGVAHASIRCYEQRRYGRD